MRHSFPGWQPTGRTVASVRGGGSVVQVPTHSGSRRPWNIPTAWMVLMCVLLAPSARAQATPLSQDAVAPTRGAPTEAPPDDPTPAPVSPDPTPSEPVAPIAPVPAPVEPAPAPGSPDAAAPRTFWEPFDKEVVRVADGSMRVCSSIALPLTIVPGVGDVVGTISDWFCIIPAAMAVDYASAQHGKRESHFWQPALALVLKKGFETLVDTPIMIVTIGAIVAVAVGGVAATVFGGLPYAIVGAGGIGITLVLYLGLKGVRDTIGNFIFEKTFSVLVEEVGDEATADERREGWLQPGMDGVPGGYGLMATVAGSRPRFNWAHAVPVVGPIWRSGPHADEIKTRTRRYAREVLHVERQDLSGLDATAETLTAVQGWSMAVGHVALGTGVGLVGAGLGVALTDEADEAQVTAGFLGAAGLLTVIGGAAAVVVSVGADRLQPLLVPLAWGQGE